VAVLAAALLHASWNLLVKSSSDRLVAAAAQVVLVAMAFIPVLIWTGLPLEAWEYVVASGMVQVAYLYSLASAYDQADLSFVYPLARGTAPLLIALGGLVGLSTPATGIGWVALALICGGVIGIGLSAETHHGVRWSLLTGVLIATYITIDGTGVRQADSTLAYTAFLYAVTGVLLMPLVLSMRGLGNIKDALRLEWKRHLFAGAASLISYGLLLAASLTASLSLVAAARETGVLFATLGGWWFLQERVSRSRVVASVVIAAGVALLALGR
ncbi:MAG TPA: EamA family transporter, partial [Acidimicrobiia bacterium]|nr:EamA family transporter [Acidimicrobiia bacterium]